MRIIALLLGLFVMSAAAAQADPCLDYSQSGDYANALPACITAALAELDGTQSGSALDRYLHTVSMAMDNEEAAFAAIHLGKLSAARHLHASAASEITLALEVGRISSDISPTAYGEALETSNLIHEHDGLFY
jgi:hypothetical protein